MELQDRELGLEREKRADEQRLAEMRSIQFRRQGELAKSASESEIAQSLSRQVWEIDQQLVALRVIATRDGRVVNPDLEGNDKKSKLHDLFQQLR